MAHSVFQSPRWSHDVTCIHQKLSAELDAILGFSNFLQVLSTVEGEKCLFEDAKDNSAHNSAQSDKLGKYNSVL